MTTTHYVIDPHRGGIVYVVEGDQVQAEAETFAARALCHDAVLVAMEAESRRIREAHGLYADGTPVEPERDEKGNPVEGSRTPEQAAQDQDAANAAIAAVVRTIPGRVLVEYGYEVTTDPPAELLDQYRRFVS